MTTATERKTLSIKSKPGMWQAPTQKEILEKKLTDSIKAALNEFNQSLPAQPSYNECFRLNTSLMQKLAQLINDAFLELKAGSRFPHQTQPIFEKIGANAYGSLVQEVGEIDANKFKEALDAFLTPKSSLPKVSLTSFK